MGGGSLSTPHPPHRPLLEGSDRALGFGTDVQGPSRPGLVLATCSPMPAPQPGVGSLEAPRPLVSLRRGAHLARLPLLVPSPPGEFPLGHSSFQPLP